MPPKQSIGWHIHFTHIGTFLLIRRVCAAATPSEKTYNQLSLCWGVYPIKARYQPDTNVLVTHAVDCAKRFGYVKTGDRVVVTAGGTGESGTTDVLKVQVVPKPLK